MHNNNFYNSLPGISEEEDEEKGIKKEKERRKKISKGLYNKTPNVVWLLIDCRINWYKYVGITKSFSHDSAKIAFNEFEDGD